MQRLIEWLIAIFIFLIPWQARWIIRAGELNQGFWEYGTAALYGTDIIFLIILVLGGIRWARQKFQSPKSKFQIKSKIQISKTTCYSLLVTGYIFLSILWSADKSVALYAALKLLEGIALFVLLTRRYSEVELPLGSSTSLFGIAFIASGVVQSVLTIVQFLTQQVVAWPWSGIAPHLPSDLGASVIQFADERWLRAYGSFPHPNLLGAFLVLALFVALRQLTSCSMTHVAQNRLRYCYMLHVTCYMLILTGIFFTFSRAAWIAAIVGAGIWLFTNGNWRHRFTQQAILLLTTYCLLLTAIFFPLVRTRLMHTERLEQRSTIERVAGYRESWQVIQRHPFLGVGVGNYTKAVHDELRLNNPSWSYQPVHNIFVLILAELGILGFGLLVIGFWLLFRSLLVTSYQLLIPLAILASLDHSFWTLHSGILVFWAFLAIYSVVHRESTAAAPPQSGGI